MHYRVSHLQRLWWYPSVALAVVVALTWTPVVAAGVNAATADPRQASAPFTSDLNSTPVDAKFAGAAETAPPTPLTDALSKHSAPLPAPTEPVARRARTASGAPTSGTRGSSERTSARTAAPSAPSPVRQVANTAPNATSKAKPASSGGSGGELGRARAILASLVRAHPTLAGATVSIGKTPGGYQAVAYYKSGRILVSTSHSASLERILRHEIWHIIDWRDNNRIDWGENVPPR